MISATAVSASWGLPKSASGSAPESGPGNWECPRVLFLVLSQGIALAGALWEHSLRHFPGVPKKALRKHSSEHFRDSPWSSPINGGRDRKRRRHSEKWSSKSRRRTNVQQLTCKMVWSFSFYSLLFSFPLFELNKTVVKQKGTLWGALRKSPGGEILINSEQVWKCVQKCQKVWTSAGTILPFSCCPWVFLWKRGVCVCVCVESPLCSRKTKKPWVAIVGTSGGPWAPQKWVTRKWP